MGEGSDQRLQGRGAAYAAQGASGFEAHLPVGIAERRAEGLHSRLGWVLGERTQGIQALLPVAILVLLDECLDIGSGVLGDSRRG